MTVSCFGSFYRTPVAISRMCLPHYNPNTLRQYINNEASYLSGFEKWLENKLGFKVSIFTVIQKQYLKTKINEYTFTMDGTIYVGKNTFKIME